MSTLIFCNQSIAATPYYVEEISLNVYSLEELSYYMLNNVYLLSNQFMSVDLANWIGRELGLTKLSGELLELIKNNAPLHIFVGHILAACGYASTKEIKELLAVISTFENKSEAECTKMRADRLMDRNKMVDAIYEYEALLDSDELKTMSSSFAADIHHNLGCAYARLFFFDEAMKNFDTAYKLGAKKVSCYNLLYSAKCKGDKNAFDAAVKKYQISQEEVESVLSNIKSLTSQKEILDFDQNLDLGQDVEQLRGQLVEWREEYNKFCKI